MVVIVKNVVVVKIVFVVVDVVVVVIIASVVVILVHVMFLLTNLTICKQTSLIMFKLTRYSTCILMSHIQSNM